MLRFRKAILLVHGFAGGNWDYGDLSNELQLYLDFDVYTFTLPGHDKSVISGVTYEEWINAACFQVDRLIKYGYKKIYVVGHSMGGVIASYLATRYKEIKKVVLAAPAFRYLSFDGEKIDLNGIGNSIKKTPKLIKAYSLEEVIARAFKMSLPASLEFSKLVKNHHNDPKNIDCPILIIQGLNDDMVPVDSSKYVYNSVKSKIKKVVYFEGVTHDIFQSDRKEEIYELVIRFFRDRYIKDNNTEKTI